MYFTVDRIENGIVVLIDDDRNVYYYPDGYFENGVSEGTVFTGVFSEYGTPSELVPDLCETEKRRLRIHEKFERIKNKGDNEQ